MCKCKIAVDVFLQDAKNGIGRFLYFASASTRKGPSHRKIGRASSSAEVKHTLFIIRQKQMRSSPFVSHIAAGQNMQVNSSFGKSFDGRLRSVGLEYSCIEFVCSGLPIISDAGKSVSTDSVSVSICSSVSSSTDSRSFIESSLPLNFFTLLLHLFVFALHRCILKVRTELKVSFYHEQIARKSRISMNVKFIAENLLRSRKCDCLCLNGSAMTNVYAVCVQLDISEGTAIQQHRFFRQRKNRMRAANRIFVASCLQDIPAVCILIFSFTVHIRNMLCG